MLLFHNQLYVRSFCVYPKLILSLLLLAVTLTVVQSQNYSNELYFKRLVDNADSLLNSDKFEEARNLYSKADEIFPNNSWKQNYLNYKIGYSYIAEDEGFLALAYFTDILFSFNPRSRHDSAFVMLVSAEVDLLTIEVLSPEYQFEALINKYRINQNEFSSWENSRFEYLIGEVFIKRLDYYNAIKYFKKSLSFLHNDLFLKEWTWYNIGAAYLELLDFQKAADIFLFLQNSGVSHLNNQKVLFSLGKAYMLIHDYQQAVTYLEKSLSSVDGRKKGYSNIETYILIGNCYLQKGETRKACNMYDKAEGLAIQYKFRSREYIQALIAKGNYFGSVNDFERQKQYYFTALDYLEATNDDVISRSIITEFLTQAFYDNKNYEQAIHYVDLFNNKYKSLNPTEIINSIGWIRYQSFHQYRALAAYRIWQSDSGNVEKLTRAYKYFNDGLRAVNGGFFSMESEESKKLVLKKIRQTYSDAFIAGCDLYNISSDPSLLDELLLLVESSKANLFKVNFRNSKAIAFSDIPSGLVKLEGTLKKQIAWLRYNLSEKNNSNETTRNISKLRNELAQAQMRYDSLMLVFENEFPQYFSERNNQPQYNLKTIQNKLFANQVVLDYFLIDKRLFIFMVSADRIAFKEISVDTNFEANILAYREMLDRPGYEANFTDNCFEFGILSHYLYKYLIDPVKTNLTGKRLITVPDREINLIPFQTLVIDTFNLSKKDFSNLNYLVYENPVTTLYSIEQLFTENKYLTRKSRFLGVAPEYLPNNDEGLKTLPGADNEISKIEFYFKGTSLLESNATKNSFLNNCANYDIIHLALHTEINEIDPLYSKLYFNSGNSNQPDAMFAYEIFEYPMHAKLLVLSGCKTGYGKIEFGEGILNLARTFFYNGVENIIVTHWSVADKSSATLMDNFYNYVLYGEPVDIALQKAKIDFLKFEDPIRSHPYYWAGYTSVGNPVAYRPFNWILLFSFIFTLIICFIIGYLIIRKEKQILERAFKQI